MENIYVLIAYVAAMVALVGAGLPALEQMQNRVVKKVLRETTREMKTMTKDLIKMQNEDY